MGDLVSRIRNRFRLNEIVVGLPRLHFARPLEIDDGVNDNIGDVHTLWPEVARHRFGKYALGCFGRRESREARFATQCGGVS